ncbi:MAG: GntR family transcriptional regulator [Paracoccaceae bacterium]|nr:GntR family transcriptional regulator [Paracoccaceae bacterium]MDE2673533.1 GntR family transcriptional regulator [Paracoccaceae bacterium]MYJ87751.1 GntR family transcriptional regulator [Paracoccaceae bacterium]
MDLQSMRRTAVPLHAEVAEVLRHQILSGTLVVGARLPTLRKLAEQLGVARMTVVQAMNTLEDEGLIEKQSGRGTFVRNVERPRKHTLHLKMEISQIYDMVDQMKVSVRKRFAAIEKTDDGRYFRYLRRIHAKWGKPFCQVDIRLDDSIFERAPERFEQEIVISVLKDLGISITRARQNVTISYADFAMAEALGIKVNSAVFRVAREFMDTDGHLIYSAILYYPSNLLEFDMEFTVD